MKLEDNIEKLQAMLSLPLRERGLKFRAHQAIRLRPPVAPFAGAWIEIGEALEQLKEKASLPLRERGLKSYTETENAAGGKSLPLRERGLK